MMSEKDVQLAKGEVNGGTQLKKTINPVILWGLASGLIIGWAWIVLIQDWFALAGHSIIISHILVALLVIPIGIAYSELMTMLPYTGGPIQYVAAAYNWNVGYWIGWIMLALYFNIVTVEIFSISKFLKYLWFPDMSMTEMQIVGIAVAILFFFLMSKSIDVGALMSFWIFILLLFVGGGWFILAGSTGSWTIQNFEPFFPKGVGGMLIGAGLMVGMYAGFDAIPQLAEEANFPRRKFPLIIIASIVTSLIFYVITILAIGGLASSTEIASTDMATSVFAARYYGDAGRYFVMLGGLCALVSTLIGTWIGGTRLLYAMGRARILPEVFSSLNKNGSPRLANVAALIYSIVFLLFAADIWVLYIVLAFGVGFVYMVVSSSVVVLRVKHPEWNRPYRMPGGMFMGVLATIASVLIFVFSLNGIPVMSYVIIAGLFIVGLVVWLYMNRLKKKYPEKYALSPVVPPTLRE